MLALHAIWSAATLHLWAEDADPPARQGRVSQPYQRRDPRPGPQGRGIPASHPFAAAVGRLREALGDTGAAGVGAEVTLLLPTSAGRPRPSPTVWWSRGSRTTSRATPRLAPWQVPSLAFGPDHAIDALLILSGEGDPTTGLAIGASVRALARAVELSLDLAARGRVLPGIARDSQGRPVARWLAAPDADDADRIVRLARSIPPLCRAEWREGSAAGSQGSAAGSPGSPAGSPAGSPGSPAGSPGSPAGSRDGRDPGEVVAELMGTVVDHVARSGIRGQQLLPAPRSRRRAPLSLAEALVAALAAEDPVLQAAEAEVGKLGRMLTEWHASGIRQAGPVRTTFRLVPPADGIGDDTGPAGPDENRWLIEFLLQSREDPSLLVPAERVWRARGRIAVLRGLVEHPRERLLTDLGHASRLYPEIERALDGAQPVGVDTDTAGAHRFLAEAAPLLQQAGFGVLVPPWWRSRATKLGLRVRARPTPSAGAAANGGLGLEAIFDYRYEVALGEDTLSAAELHRLAELKVPLVRVRGQWVELRIDEIDTALRSLEQGSNGARATAAELLRAERARSVRGRPARREHLSGGLARRAAGRRPADRAAIRAGHLQRIAPAVPGAGAQLVGVHGPDRARRLPG